MNAHQWWDESVFPSIKEGWISGDPRLGQRRRFNALVHLYKKLGKSGTELSVSPMIILAPDFAWAGAAFRRTVRSDLVVLYLAPMLEFFSQRDADFVAAHELAHIQLGHISGRLNPAETGLPHELKADEIAADALATKWGFSKRKRGKNGFARLLERGGAA